MGDRSSFFPSHLEHWQHRDLWRAWWHREAPKGRNAPPRIGESEKLAAPNREALAQVLGQDDSRNILRYLFSSNARADDRRASGVSSTPMLSILLFH